jgi:DNA-binding CsgD family transcriptional regulator
MNSEPNERMSYVVSNMASSQQNTGQEISLAGGKGQMASKLWLNHSQVEHQIYEVMLAEVMAAKTRVCAFSLRQLMILTRLPNYSAIRRGLNGLIQKHSIERYKVVGDTNSRQQVTVYFVFTPEEILERNEFVAEHSELGKDVESSKAVIGHAMSRIAERNDLSRREAEVAICCAEGLTNQEIGKRLYISEQTVKFHLRHIFVKYGVKRRTELISQLLSQMNSSSDDMESRK